MIMLALHVFIATLQLMAVESLDIKKSWGRNEHVAPDITDLIFDIAFLIASRGIAENRFKVVMILKAKKKFGADALTVFFYFTDQT